MREDGPSEYDGQDGRGEAGARGGPAICLDLDALDGAYERADARLIVEKGMAGVDEDNIQQHIVRNSQRVTRNQIATEQRFWHVWRSTFTCRPVEH